MESRSRVSGQLSGCNQGLAHSTPSEFPGPSASASASHKVIQSLAVASEEAGTLARASETSSGTSRNGPTCTTQRTKSATLISPPSAATRSRTGPGGRCCVTSSGASTRLCPSRGASIRRISRPAAQTWKLRGQMCCFGSERLTIRSSMPSPSNNVGTSSSTSRLPRPGHARVSAAKPTKAKALMPGLNGSITRKLQAQSPPRSSWPHLSQGAAGACGGARAGVAGNPYRRLEKSLRMTLAFSTGAARVCVLAVTASGHFCHSSSSATSSWWLAP
mmetsp:Transcript_49234/g.107090  ORF Transcript_49234/g.107090 Transcript_49234/m.107090 type:complete len:275 (+) Transcript_49234:614-1438(+)